MKKTGFLALFGLFLTAVAGIGFAIPANASCEAGFTCNNSVTLGTYCAAHGFYPIADCVQSVQALMNAYHNPNSGVTVTQYDTSYTLWQKVVYNDPYNPTPPTCPHIAMDMDRGDGGEGTHGGH